jgi:hypothetical protein
MVNISIVDAVEGEAFSIQIMEVADLKIDAGWLPRLISKHLADAIAPDHIQWRFPIPKSRTLLLERVNEQSRPRLQIDFVTEESLAATVVGARSEQVYEEREIWWKAVKLAIEELTLPPPKRQWDCLIGPLPVGQHHIYRLKGPMAVGGMSIPQPDRKMTESAPGFRHGILFNNGHSSWPLMVSGSYSSYEEEGIPDEPMPDIQALCLVLSLAMDQPWGPRHNPMGRRDHRLVIPPIADSAKHIDRSGLDPDSYSDGFIELDIRRWAKKAWEAQRDKRNRRIKNAIEMYLEGMILEGNHQSFARIAYVSAIEDLRDGDPEECEACGQVKGITQKYRETVESAGMNFVEDVYGPDYSFRSRAVHDGVLDPEDSRWGQSSFRQNLWMHDDSDWKRRVWLLRQKVRALILNRLGLDDPLAQDDA